MKHQFLLFLALLGAVLLWPGCDDDDDMTVDCEVDVPFIAFSDDCNPDPVNLTNLSGAQDGRLPALPTDGCSVGPNSRIIRLNGSADGDFYLHIYVGIPATISYEVFGADCEEGITQIQSCVSSDAIAIADVIDDGADFSDVYVRIKYDIFTTDNYVNYALQPDSYISVVAYDELPKAIGQSGGISYARNGEGPEGLIFNCDESSFQRIIITSCNPDAEVNNWAAEIGLPVSESCLVDGVTVTALDVPEGMNTDFVGDGTSGPGGADKPLTTERRPKKDSTDFIVEEDYIIEVSSNNDGLYPLTDDCTTGQGPTTIGPDNTCFKPDDETLACLAFTPGKVSSEDAENVVITMIDSGADDFGVMRDVFFRNRYRGSEQYKFLLKNSLGYDFIRGDFEPGDEIGHGTATAGTVVGGYNGQAPLTVVHYKIFGDEGLASYFGAIVAINSAIEIKSTIINMSWGIPQERIPLALQCAVTRASNADIAIVTTAGNEGDSIDDPAAVTGAQPQWPGAFSDPVFKFGNLITVGSMAYPDFDLNQEPTKVDYSNFSSTRVDVAAYLTSATPRWRTASLDDIVYLAGTSISAPIISRSLASYLGPNGNNLPQWANDKLLPSSSLEVQGYVENGLYLPLCADLFD